MAENKRKLALMLMSMSDTRVEKVLSALKSAEDGNEQPSSPDRPKPKTPEDLIAVYHEKQKLKKITPSTAGPSHEPTSSKKKGKGKGNLFSLNFGRVRRAGLTYRRTTAPVQVVGFSDSDSYQSVVAKGARGLGIKDIDPKNLALIVSNGLVLDSPIHGQNPWTLGDYVEEFGGVQARCKKSFGILIEIEQEEDTSPVEVKVKRKTAPSEESDDTVAAKRRRQASPTPTPPGTTKMSAIHIESWSTGTEVINLDTLIARYCPIKSGEVLTSVIATGRHGVWRIAHVELDESDEHVQQQLEEDLPALQPEVEPNPFVLVELTTNTDTYLQGSPMKGNSVSLKSLSFTTKAHLIHSCTSINKPSNTTVPLLCLSPDHGKVAYTWERSACGTLWETLKVPGHTCLLYVQLSGFYRCTVAGNITTFRVKPTESDPGIGADLVVDYQDLEIGDVVGKGSFATVHKGKWKGQDVALKRLRLPGGFDAGSVTDIKEIEVLRQLKHPNIISLLGYSVNEDEFLLITNFVNGSNLFRLLFGKRDKREFSAHEVKQIATKIAQGVQYMHHHRPVVIHQDLKPQNVLITHDLRSVFICDMGVTKLKKVSEATLTSTSRGPGTLPYMAPEMFKKARRGPPVDIYSLGCLYLELFARRRVWPGLDGTEIMMKVCGAFNTPPTMPDLEICGSCCQLDPSNRPNIDQTLEMIARL